MPLKILHANAKAFEETERNTRLADGSIQKSMNQPHPLVAYRQFWYARGLELGEGARFCACAESCSWVTD